MPNQDTRFLLTFERRSFDGPELAFRANPVHVGDDTQEVRNIIDQSYKHDPLADLTLSGHMSARYPDTIVFGSPTYLEAHSVPLGRAVVMASTLRKLDRRLRAIEPERGAPRDYPDLLTRMGEVLGIRKFGWRECNVDLETRAYAWSDANGLIWKFGHEVESFREGIGAVRA